MSLLIITILLSFFSEPTWREHREWKKYFAEAHVQGSMLLYDIQHNTYEVYNLNRVKKQYLPASTYKILNSLIALETGVVKDEHETIPWDSVTRIVPAWNHTQDMKEAFQNSTVWYYQEVARRIGHERMQHFVRLAHYGNQNIGGEIDQFWLRGNLRISSEEQIQFLVRLYRNELPFSSRSTDIVKDIMINEQTDSYTLRAKAGWVGFGDDSAYTNGIGWWVGYVERNKNAFFFALNIDIRDIKDAAARKTIVNNILTEMNILH